MSRRIEREKKTIRAMVGIYCRAHHEPGGAPGGEPGGELCVECGELLDYALRRLDCCPFGAKKTPCAKCPIHCYRPSMREEVKLVMRFAGPRMISRHPLLAFLHLLDGWRRPADPKRPS